MVLSNQKPVFITTIVLLVLVIALFVGGYFYKEPTAVLKPEVIENPTLEFEVGNRQYKYECQTPECSIAKTDIEANYYFSNYAPLIEDELVVNNYMMFIKESEEIILYNYKTSHVLADKYMAVKTNSILKDKYMYIAQDKEGKWGVFRVDDETLFQLIPFEYDYIGMTKEAINQNNPLFVAYKNDKYYIIDLENNIQYETENRIEDYNNRYIVISTENSYTLLNYGGGNVMSSSFDGIMLINDYIGILNDSYFYVYDITSRSRKTDNYQVDSLSSIKFEILESGQIKLNIGENEIVIS